MAIHPAFHASVLRRTGQLTASMVKRMATVAAVLLTTLLAAGCTSMQEFLIKEAITAVRMGGRSTTTYQAYEVYQAIRTAPDSGHETETATYLEDGS